MTFFNQTINTYNTDWSSNWWPRDLAWFKSISNSWNYSNFGFWKSNYDSCFNPPLINQFYGNNSNPFQYKFDYSWNLDTFQKTSINYNNSLNNITLTKPIAPSWSNMFNISSNYSSSPKKNTSDSPAAITSNQSTSINQHNIETISLTSLDLNGTIAGCNSVPSIAKQNIQKLKNLDKILAKWGYEIVYTSAMGGKHVANSGHYKGNKVDLQLMKNGKPAHLTNEQLAYLKQQGYWGSGTGAVGWEAHSNQTGGGHYDLYIA